MVFTVISPGTLYCERKKVLFFSRSLITTHKFNNHSSISLFLTAWLCKLTRHQCTCSHFITIAYNLIPRVLSPEVGSRKSEVRSRKTLRPRLLQFKFSLRCLPNPGSLVLVLQFLNCNLKIILGRGRGSGKWEVRSLNMQHWVSTVRNQKSGVRTLSSMKSDIWRMFWCFKPLLTPRGKGPLSGCYWITSFEWPQITRLCI